MPYGLKKYGFNEYGLPTYALPEYATTSPATGGTGLPDVDAAGVYGYWLIDEGSGTALADSKANHSDAAITGCTWLGTSAFDYPGADSLDFDGAGDYVNLGVLSEINAVSNFTVYGWSTLDSLAVGGTLWGKLHNTSTRCYIQHSTTTIYIEFRAGTTVYLTLTGIGTWITAGAPFMWAIAFDGAGATNSDKLKLYINGALMGTATITGTVSGTSPAISTDVFLGSYNGSSDLLKGEQSLLVTYNDTRSASEISDDYDAWQASL